MPYRDYNVVIPQVSALSGRRSKTPLSQKYDYGALRTASTPQVNVPISPTPQPTPVQPRLVPRETMPTTTPFFTEGGPGPSYGGGVSGGGFGPQGQTSENETGIVGNIIGSNIAGMLGGKGAISGLATTALGTTLGLPASSIIGPALGSAVSSALAPIGLANVIGGGIITGNIAQGSLESMQESGIPTSVAEDVTEAIIATSPSTLTGHLMGLAKNITPSESAQSMVDLTAAMADQPGGFATNAPTPASEMNTAFARAMSLPFNPKAITINEQIGVGPALGSTVGGFNPGGTPSAPTGRAANPNISPSIGVAGGVSGAAVGGGAASGSPTGEAGLIGGVSMGAGAAGGAGAGGK